MDEKKVRETIRKVEAQRDSTPFDAERETACRMLETLRAKLAAAREQGSLMEISYSLMNEWERRVLFTLCRHYGLRTFRRRGQRQSTVIVLVSASFQHGTLWPHFVQLTQTLDPLVDGVVSQFLRESIPDKASW